MYKTYHFRNGMFQRIPKYFVPTTFGKPASDELDFYRK